MSQVAAITGVGCVSAYGIGAETLWANVRVGKGAELSVRNRVCGQAQFCLQAPASEQLTSGKAASTLMRPGRSTLLARAAAEEAWLSSGAAAIASDRVGLLANRNFGQHQIIAQYYETLWNKGPSGVSGMQFVQTIANCVLGSLAMHFQVRGPSTLHFGATCLGEALDLLRDGAADAVLAGGFDELSDYIFELCYANGLAPPQTSGEVYSHPYDPASKGIIPSEGSAFFVLEPMELAQARGAAVQGVLKGYASLTDREAVQDPAVRSSADWAETIRRALRDADVLPGEVAFVSGAANGLVVGDAAEINAVRAVLAAEVPVFSIKECVGETWGAAGCLAVFAALCALQDQSLPPYGTRPAIPVKAGPALVLSAEMSAQNTAFVIDLKP